MTEALRVAVVGAGMMGQNHLRVYETLKGVEIAAVVDVDRERAQRSAARFGCLAAASVDEIVGKVDAASVSVPSSLHASIGCYLLENGVHCLVEKPLAPTQGECEQLIAAADGAGVVLMVGHIERFNPAVERCIDIFRGRPETIRAIEAHRMSSVSSRITDVDVVADLMVHDIDIVLALLGTAPDEVFARGVRLTDRDSADYVASLLAFSGGRLAALTASRITQNKVRQLCLTTDLGFVVLDYTTQEILIHRQGNVAGLGSEVPEQGEYVLDLAIERVFVRGAEPLSLELRHFVDVVVGGAPLRVGGREALEAMRVVWRVQRDLVATR